MWIAAAPSDRAATTTANATSTRRATRTGSEGTGAAATRTIDGVPVPPAWRRRHDRKTRTPPATHTTRAAANVTSSCEPPCDVTVDAAALVWTSGRCPAGLAIPGHVPDGEADDREAGVEDVVRAVGRDAEEAEHVRAHEKGEEDDRVQHAEADRRVGASVAVQAERDVERDRARDDVDDVVNVVRREQRVGRASHDRVVDEAEEPGPEKRDPGDRHPPFREVAVAPRVASYRFVPHRIPPCVRRRSCAAIGQARRGPRRWLPFAAACWMGVSPDRKADPALSRGARIGGLNTRVCRAVPSLGSGPGIVFGHA